jgi:hypothetical protein
MIEITLNFDPVCVFGVCLNMHGIRFLNTIPISFSDIFTVLNNGKKRSKEN